MHVQFVLALGRSRLTFREVHTKYFGNSGEGYVRLRPGSWEASKQGGDSAGHEIRQELGLGRVEPAEGATSAQAWPTGGSAGRCVYGMHYMTRDWKERGPKGMCFS